MVVTSRSIYMVYSPLYPQIFHYCLEPFQVAHLRLCIYLRKIARNPSYDPNTLDGITRVLWFLRFVLVVEVAVCYIGF